jgi:hypothetical protein
MGRPRIYSDEERKERKKKYDNKYQNARYAVDEEYRKMKSDINKANHEKYKLLKNQNKELIN